MDPLDSSLLDDFRGRQVTLVGLGARTHVALARYLVRQGARVRISERKPREQLSRELELIADLPVDLRLGGHRPEDVLDADVVFVSPGVPREIPILQLARDRGIPISSEIELLFARCRAPIVGITGSAGKTTTTTLVGEMLRADARSVYVGGNIGVPLIEKVDDIAADSWVVLELSSYQLEALRRGARIGAILNVTPNHLDRHPTFEHYRESKFNLLRYQTPGGYRDSWRRRSCRGVARPALPRLGSLVLGAARRGPWRVSTRRRPYRAGRVRRRAIRNRLRSQAAWLPQRPERSRRCRDRPRRGRGGLGHRPDRRDVQRR